MVNVSPLGFPDVIVSWKAPVTLPLKFPLRTNAPLPVSPETKHGVCVVKVRLVTVTVVPTICVKVVVSANTGALLVLVRVALQLPLMFPAPLEPPLPHAASTSVSAAKLAIAILRIETPCHVFMGFLPMLDEWH